MRVLVTGSDGFVGRHLCRELEMFGHTVIPFDVDNVPVQSVNDPSVVVSNVALADIVIHLAAVYGRLICEQQIEKAISTNAGGTAIVARACMDQGKPLLYASSSEVYGNHFHDTISELTPLKTPTTIYGLSKRWGEEAIFMYKEHQTKAAAPPYVACIRMNMLYGPGQQTGFGRAALANFIQNAKDGKPSVIHDRATRAWLYIADAVEALRVVAEALYEELPSVKQHPPVWNLGTTEEPTTLLSQAIAVYEAFGVTSPEASTSIDIQNPPDNAIQHKNYDVTRIQEDFYWSPSTCFEDGLARTIAWFKEK